MRALLIVAIWLAASVAAYAQARGEISLFGHGELNGPMYNWEVTAQRFAAQPRWQPANPTLPLPIPKAISVAERWIKSRNPEVKNFTVASVSISPMACCTREDSDRWYFRIEFNPVVGGQPLFGGHFIAVVLFDGTVVEPRIEKR